MRSDIESLLQDSLRETCSHTNSKAGSKSCASGLSILPDTYNVPSWPNAWIGPRHSESLLFLSGHRSLRRQDFSYSILAVSTVLDDSSSGLIELLNHCPIAALLTVAVEHSNTTPLFRKTVFVSFSRRYLVVHSIIDSVKHIYNLTCCSLIRIKRLRMRSPQGAPVSETLHASKDTVQTCFPKFGMVWKIKLDVIRVLEKLCEYAVNIEHAPQSTIIVGYMFSWEKLVCIMSIAAWIFDV